MAILLAIDFIIVITVINNLYQFSRIFEGHRGVKLLRDQYYHWASERYSSSDMRFWTSSSSSLSIHLFFFNRYVLFIDAFCIWSSIIKVIIFCIFDIFHRFTSCENHATPSRDWRLRKKNWRQKLHYSTGKMGTLFLWDLKNSMTHLKTRWLGEIPRLSANSRSSAKVLMTEPDTLL